MTNIEGVVINYLSNLINIPVRAELANEGEEIQKPYIVVDLTSGSVRGVSGFAECSITIQTIHDSKIDACNLANQVCALMNNSANEVPEIMSASCNLPYNWSIDNIYKYQFICDLVYKFF